ncbi:NAD(P)/FAD-dependent oxidoreductase [Dongia soli]|uniref:FAD-binding oxidoreductase n=1 Tax=Dongia soli TaxID=600628 RepID=A0ABU5EB89_9PROT|nr:FAD-binding oxidoreductase [Dongia soli]MDY0883630.1 FAD-binding oxidoreductase [Dongia soli]
MKTEPYWWDLARPVPIAAETLPTRADVVIVGSGYTGLSAALLLARAGRHVIVLDKEDPGFGASRRNAGYIGRTLKKSFPSLMKSHGEAYARAVYHELDAALKYVRSLVKEENIECHIAQPGRFIGATSPTHYEAMAQDYEITRRYMGFDYHMVPRSDQRQELATDRYYGGVVIPDLGSLHPGLYHKGLLERAMQAGAQVAGRTEVQAVEGQTPDIKVSTSRGIITAKNVIIATNGYTPRQFPWHARRVIPFTGYMAATEILPEELVGTCIPHRRTVIDSNLNIDFVRPAPDTPRILLGGSTGSRLTTTTEMANRLREIMLRVLPGLKDVSFSHVWSGQCAGTFDMMPHLGMRDGIWFGLGYNFAGVPMGTYFGKLIANQIIGKDTKPSVFSQGKVPTMPFYHGNPWFVPYAMRYFDWQDQRIARQGARQGGRQ